MLAVCRMAFPNWRGSSMQTAHLRNKGRLTGLKILTVPVDLHCENARVPIKNLQHEIMLCTFYVATTEIPAGTLLLSALPLQPLLCHGCRKVLVGGARVTSDVQ